MSERKGTRPDPYHGVGGRYVINERGERVPAPDKAPPAKPAARKRKEKPS